MRRIVVGLLVLSLATSAFAVDGSEVMYTGGSDSAFKPGDVGTFETAPVQELAFVSGGKKLTIAYDKITKIDYRQEVAHHLGIAPAIVVALIKKRERKHFITLTYADDAGKRQAVVFEISKAAPRSLLAIFAARSPHACITKDEYQSCPVAPQRTVASTQRP